MNIFLAYVFWKKNSIFCFWRTSDEQRIEYHISVCYLGILLWRNFGVFIVVVIWMVLFNKSMTFGHHFIPLSLSYKQHPITFLRLWRKKPYYSIGDLCQAPALLNCSCLWSVWLRFLLVKPSTIQMSNNNVAIFHLEISVSPVRWSISLIHILTLLPMYFYVIQGSL